MKTKMKALTLVLCAMLLVVASVMGTLAYLKATSDTVVNTFTVGKVGIKLDEAPVDEYGKVVTGDRRITNTYKLMPGHTYTKDPMVTVKAESESSYIRMKVTIEGYDQLVAAFPKETFAEFWSGDMFLLEKLVSNWDRNIWQSYGYDAATKTYEFRYYNTVDTLGKTDTALEPLFKFVVVPGTLNNDQILALNGVKINIVAHAIQADGFANADAAWTAFDQQA